MSTLRRYRRDRHVDDEELRHALRGPAGKVTLADVHVSETVQITNEWATQDAGEAMPFGLAVERLCAVETLHNPDAKLQQLLVVIRTLCDSVQQFVAAKERARQLGARYLPTSPCRDKPDSVVRSPWTRCAAAPCLGCRVR